jgi:hypothetical protein
LTPGADPALAPLELDGSSSSLDPDLDAATRIAIRTIVVRGVHHLSGADAFDSIAMVRLLRRAMSYGLNVLWDGSLDPAIDVETLVHLPPPTPGGNDLVVTRWCATFRAGLCYYRVGPDFVFVKDVRDGGKAARFRLDHPGVLEQFRTLESVVTVSDLDGETRELLDALIEERLALRLGELATLLPYRMRRWPVPAIDV